MWTLGSLFDGIGGFPLAAVHNGIKPVWASEVEAFPIRVTKIHFPEIEHLGEPAQWYSNSGDLCAAGLYRSENCSIKQKSPGSAGALVLFHICGRCGHGAAGGAEDYEERSRSD